MPEQFKEPSEETTEKSNWDSLTEDEKHNILEKFYAARKRAIDLCEERKQDPVQYSADYFSDAVDRNGLTDLMEKYQLVVTGGDGWFVLGRHDSQGVRLDDKDAGW